MNGSPFLHLWLWLQLTENALNTRTQCGPIFLVSYENHFYRVVSKRQYGFGNPQEV